MGADFVEQHLKKFLDLAKGGETGAKAWYQIGLEWGKETAKGLSGEKKEIFETALSIIEQLPDDAKIGIQGEFDPSNIIGAMNLTAQKAAELQDVLNSIGFSPTLTFCLIV
jgi:hypothetical protein